MMNVQEREEEVTLKYKQINEEIKKLYEVVARNQEEVKENPGANRNPGICSLCVDAKGEYMSLESRCGHNFHQGCIRLYLLSTYGASFIGNVNNGAASLLCPICNDSISDKDVEKLLKKEEYEKYTKQRFLEELTKSGVQFQKCPKCGDMFEYADADKPTSVRCATCQFVYFVVV